VYICLIIVIFQRTILQLWQESAHLVYDLSSCPYVCVWRCKFKRWTNQSSIIYI